MTQQKEVSEWLHGLTREKLQALREVIDRELRRRERDNARPAEQPGRVGRGGIYLKVDD